jgi:dTDP-4-dehydrorhamnose 3,5-epimerase
VEPFTDERGSFSRTFSQEEFTAHGLSPDVSQCSTSWNPRRGTLRGMHYQREPHGEHKLIRCTRGAAYGVAVDLRPEAATFCRWIAIELRADERRALYVPPGMAFGFQSLEDGTEILYMMSQPYAPSHYAGVRWNDPAFAIEWPDVDERIISEKDAGYPDFRP